MNAQKSLNNVRRKMLDEIYGNEFDKKANAILEQRNQDLEALKATVIKDESNRAAVKKVLRLGESFYEAVKAIQPELRELGLNLTNVPFNLNPPALEISGGYSSNTHPALTAYRAGTNRIEMELTEKKRGMRARIYGVQATYEDIQRDIDEILRGVKA
jgi:hypothetical protein